MLNQRVTWPILVLLVVVSSTSSTHLRAQGLVWDFLGDAHIDGVRDHEKIHVGGHHGAFRAVQLRVSGEAIFFQRLIISYGNGTSEELTIGQRISPEGKTHIIDLPGTPRVLESVEFWYFSESWEHRPRVSLYGTR